jgi:hypothetical protein
MIQIVFMVIGVANLFKLIRMNNRTGSEFGFDPMTLARWQSLRRTQYAWMIAAGWGSFAMAVVVGFVMGMSGMAGETSALTVQMVALGASLVVMFGCYAVSAKAANQAKALEALKGPFVNPGVQSGNM